MQQKDTLSLTDVLNSLNVTIHLCILAPQHIVSEEKGQQQWQYGTESSSLERAAYQTSKN